MDLYLKSRKDSGIMWGSYDFISDLDGRTFSVHIPKFDLTPTIIPASLISDFRYVFLFCVYIYVASIFTGIDKFLRIIYSNESKYTSS